MEKNGNKYVEKKTTHLLELLVFSFNPTWKCVEVIFDFVGCIFVGQSFDGFFLLLAIAFALQVFEHLIPRLIRTTIQKCLIRNEIYMFRLNEMRFNRAKREEQIGFAFNMHEQLENNDIQRQRTRNGSQSTHERL